MSACPACERLRHAYEEALFAYDSCRHALEFSARRGAPAVETLRDIVRVAAAERDAALLALELHLTEHSR